MQDKFQGETGRLVFKNNCLQIEGFSNEAHQVFQAEILEIHDGYYLVKPVEGSWELSSADRIEVPIRNYTIYIVINGNAIINHSRTKAVCCTDFWEIIPSKVSKISVPYWHTINQNCLASKFRSVKGF